MSNGWEKKTITQHCAAESYVVTHEITERITILAQREHQLDMHYTCRTRVVFTIRPCVGIGHEYYIMMGSVC